MKLSVGQAERYGEVLDLPTALRREGVSRKGRLEVIDEPQGVVITGLRIPFLHLVWHLIKLVLAAVPALALLAALAYGGLLLMHATHMSWRNLEISLISTP